MKSRKGIATLVCCFFLIGGGFADEAVKISNKDSSTSINTESFHRGMSIAGLWESDSLKAGGGCEFGFALANPKKVFVCRDYFTASGYGWYSGLGEISIGNKLQLGSKIDSGNFFVIPYGFIQINASILLSAENRFGCWIGGGGGFEFQFHPTSSFFIEYGGRGFIPHSAGTSFLCIGYRQYF